MLNKKHQGIDVGLPCFGCLLFVSRHHEDMGECGRMRPDMEPDVFRLIGNHLDGKRCVHTVDGRKSCTS